MSRRKVSEAISNLDERYIVEAMLPPEVKYGHTPERTIYMDKHNHVFSRRIFGLALAACLVFALAVTAYAVDVGGIQRIIRIWWQGSEANAVIDGQCGTFTVSDKNGVPVATGVGVSIEEDGSERPLTEAELIEHLEQPDLYYKEDGTVWVYYRDRKIEITDQFDADGICCLELSDGDDVLYLTITQTNGMTISRDGYVKP